MVSGFGSRWIWLFLVSAFATGCGNDEAPGRSKPSKVLLAENLKLTVDEDESLTASFALAETESTTVTLIGKPKHGTAKLSLDSFTYTPEANFNGKDSFTYEIERDGATASGTVTITITPVNDKPLATLVTLSDTDLFAGEPLTVSPQGWLDVDGDAEQYHVRWEIDGVTVPALGLSLPGSYVVRGKKIRAVVTPFDGTEEGTSLSTQTVTVNNSAPVAAADAFATAEDVAYTAAFPAASDIDSGDTFAYEVVTAPAHGVLTFPSPISYTYTPTANYYGADSFTYRVSDGQTGSKIYPINIAVTPVYDPPTIVNPNRTTSCTVGGATPTTSSYLPDGGSITYSLGAGTTCNVSSIDLGTGEVLDACPVLKTGPCVVEVVVSDGTQTVSDNITITPNAIRYVGPTALGARDGTSWNDATTSVQAAIDALAGTGGAVWMKSGTYTSTSNDPVATLADGVDLHGGFTGTEVNFSDRSTVNPALTVLSGDTDLDGTHSSADAYHVVVGIGGEYNLSGFTVAWGNATSASGAPNGGGLWLDSSQAFIHDIVFTNNHADNQGGGFRFRYGAVSGERLDVASNTAGNASGGGTIHSIAGAFTDVTVQGNSASTGGGGVYIVGTASVTLDNWTFEENSANLGGAVYTDTSGSVTLNDPIFRWNTASQGGSIAVYSGPVTLQNAYFTENTASAAADVIYAVSGADVVLKSSTITRNTGKGAIFVSGSGTSVVANDTVFSVNSASGDAGAVNLESGSTLTCSRSYFLGNSSQADGGSVRVFGASAYFYDSAFTQNTATTGGAILVLNGSLDAERTTFQGNQATVDYGGAIENVNGALVLSATTFAQNTAASEGGAIDFYGGSAVADITSSTFTSNTATSRAGAITAYDGVNVSVKSSVFTGNSSANRSGVFYIYNSTLNVDGSTFTGNSATNLGGVGALYAGADAVIDGSTFTTNSSAEGGAWYADGAGTTLTFKDSMSSGNTASGQGGAVYVLNGAQLKDDGSTWSANTATGNGGAVSENGSATSAFFYASLITGNTTSGSGGGIYATDGSVTLEMATVYGNQSFVSSSAAGGGALFGNNTVAVQVTGTTFTANTATSARGGALFLATSGSSLDVSESTFASNHSAWGGAIYATDTQEVFKKTTFTGNVSDNRGGAIYPQNGTLTISSSAFDSNSGSFGGAIRTVNTALAITGTTFTSNAVGGDGGALNIQGGTHYMEASTFTTNSAGGRGGSVYLQSGTTMRVTDVTLARNSAVSYGAGFWVNGGTLYVYGADVTGNTSNSGAGVYLEGSGRLVVHGARFYKNEVQANGGAIEQANTNARLYVYDSVFDGNSAVGDGGAIRISSGDGAVTNVTFKNNVSGAWGSAVRILTGLTIESSAFFANTSSSGVGGAMSQGGGTSVVMDNSVFYGNTGAELEVSGTLTANYNCLTTNLGGTNVTTATDPFIEAAGGELFLDQSSGCINAGGNSTADSSYTALGYDWRNLTTDFDGLILESVSGMVDPGVHYDPTHVWVKTFGQSGGTFNWSLNQGGTTCAITNSVDGTSVTVAPADLPAGSYTPAQAWASGTTVTLTCENPWPYLPAMASVVMP